MRPNQKRRDDRATHKYSHTLRHSAYSPALKTGLCFGPLGCFKCMQLLKWHEEEKKMTKGQKKVKKVMREFKKGTLKIGGSDKKVKM